MKVKFEIKIEVRNSCGDVYRHELVSDDFCIVKMFLDSYSENINDCSEEGAFDELQTTP